MKIETKLEFAGYITIPEEFSNISSKGGSFTKVQPKIIKRFKNPENLDVQNKYVYVSDYGRKKYKRNERLNEFYNEFYQPFKKKQITILCLILNVEFIKCINKYIKYFKTEKLYKLGIEATSHLRINDIGKKYSKPHCHVFIVTEYMEETKIDEIFRKRKSKAFSVISMNETFGLIRYCQKKELYVKGKGKSWSGSPLFKHPKKLTKLN